MATLWGGRQGGVRWGEEEGGRAPREGGGAVDVGEQGRRGGDDDGEAVRHVEEEGMGAPGRTMATVGKEERGRRARMRSAGMSAVEAEDGRTPSAGVSAVARSGWGRRGASEQKRGAQGAVEAEDAVRRYGKRAVWQIAWEDRPMKFVRCISKLSFFFLFFHNEISFEPD